MASDGKGDGTETRMAALLLSSLVTCSDAGLATFKDKRLAGVDVDVDAVRRVRDLARVLGELLKNPGDPRWPHLEDAWRAIVARDAPPEPPPPEPEPPPPVEALPLEPPPLERKPRIAPPPDSEPSHPPLAPMPLPPPPAPVQLPAMQPPEAQSTKPPVSLSSDALPFPAQHEALAGISTGHPRMTVTIYAALCACCGAFPLRIAETHAKFGVADTRARSALDVAWREKFREDPRLQVLWKSLFDQFRGWLVQHGAL